MIPRPKDPATSADFSELADAFMAGLQNRVRFAGLAIVKSVDLARLSGLQDDQEIEALLQQTDPIPLTDAQQKKLKSVGRNLKHVMEERYQRENQARSYRLLSDQGLAPVLGSAESQDASPAGPVSLMVARSFEADLVSLGRGLLQQRLEGLRARREAKPQDALPEPCFA